MGNQHETDERLETPKQLAKRVGVSERQIRYLVETRNLDYVMIGCRVHIPDGAFRRFLASRTVKSCPDETKGRDCGGWQSASASTSPGPNTAGAASAQLARQTAHKLKSSSLNGCSGEVAEKAQVIPLRSSSLT
jgi:hypothetical protein